MSVRVKFHLHEPVRAMPGHSKRSTDGWLVCCQSMDRHRAGCAEAPPVARGAGKSRTS